MAESNSNLIHNQHGNCELKPCPFCGGEAKIYQNYMYQHNIQCKKCGCVVWAKNSRSVEYAKTAWNTRTPKERGGEN